MVETGVAAPNWHISMARSRRAAPDIHFRVPHGLDGVKYDSFVIKTTIETAETHAERSGITNYSQTLLSG